jgi:glycosyltransferase involved in cell wall biosynthesis
MIKLVIDSRMIQSSGIGSYLQNLIPFISNSTSTSVISDSAIISSFKWGNQVNVINVHSAIYSIREQFEIFNKIPRCDVFWSPHYNVPIFPVKANRRVVTIHDVNHLAFFDELNLQQKIYAKLMSLVSTRLSRKIITVSNFSKSEIIRYINADEGKIDVIYNGIDTERFTILDPAEVERTKKKCGIPDKFIMFVGNVKPHKNLLRLLLAYEKLYCQNLKDYFLVIVGRKEGFIIGNSEIFSILENNTVLRERVLFTGYLENADLSAIYNSASLLVLPSLYEGFGLPPLEAMACNCPVVVSNVASLPEVCGDAAHYVDPYDVESIAEGIYNVLSNESLRQDLIKKGAERVKLFSWERSAREHLRVFEEALSA